MKVLIIGSFDLYLHPYIEKYVSILEQNNIDYKLIYWNREGVADLNKNHIPFNYVIKNTSKLSKIKGYIKFFLFVKRYIKNNAPKFIVFLASQTMFLFSYLAIHKFKDRYIFDYRDETYEKYMFYLKIMKKCIENSSITVVSSLGFIKNIFGKNEAKKVILCHNMKNSYIHCGEKIESDKIRINFWGLIRQQSYYNKIINFFGNDPRFEINFFGTGDTELLKNNIINNQINNIKMNGKYEKSDMPNMVAQTDILLNCYSNNSVQKNALTVKMYDGLYYDIPMIIQKNSYMENYLLENNYQLISIDFDIENDNLEDLKEKIIKKYKNYNNDYTRKILLEKIIKENDEFNKFITKILLGIGD